MGRKVFFGLFLFLVILLSSCLAMAQQNSSNKVGEPTQDEHVEVAAGVNKVQGSQLQADIDSSAETDEMNSASATWSEPVALATIQSNLRPTIAADVNGDWHLLTMERTPKRIMYPEDGSGQTATIYYHKKGCDPQMVVEQYTPYVDDPNDGLSYVWANGPYIDAPSIAVDGLGGMHVAYLRGIYDLGRVRDEHSVMYTYLASASGTQFKLSHTFYFAEGYTGAGFEEWLCLLNPNNSPTTAHITFMFKDGSTQSQDVNIGATTRETVDVNAVVGAGKDVSIKVEADSPIVAERPMYFAYKGIWMGGHDVLGANK
jgi:hypothetical protein